MMRQISEELNRRQPLLHHTSIEAFPLDEADHAIARSHVQCIVQRLREVCGKHLAIEELFLERGKKALEGD